MIAGVKAGASGSPAVPLSAAASDLARTGFRFFAVLH